MNATRGGGASRGRGWISVGDQPSFAQATRTLRTDYKPTLRMLQKVRALHPALPEDRAWKFLPAINVQFEENTIYVSSLMHPYRDATAAYQNERAGFRRACDSFDATLLVSADNGSLTAVFVGLRKKVDGPAPEPNILLENISISPTITIGLNQFDAPVTDDLMYASASHDKAPRDGVIFRTFPNGINIYLCPESAAGIPVTDIIGYDATKADRFASLTVKGSAPSRDTMKATAKKLMTSFPGTRFFIKGSTIRTLFAERPTRAAISDLQSALLTEHMIECTVRMDVRFDEHEMGPNCATIAYEAIGKCWFTPDVVTKLCFHLGCKLAGKNNTATSIFVRFDTPEALNKAVQMQKTGIIMTPWTPQARSG